MRSRVQKVRWNVVHMAVLRAVVQEVQHWRNTDRATKFRWFDDWHKLSLGAISPGVVAGGMYAIHDDSKQWMMEHCTEHDFYKRQVSQPEELPGKQGILFVVRISRDHKSITAYFWMSTSVTMYMWMRNFSRIEMQRIYL